MGACAEIVRNLVPVHAEGWSRRRRRTPPALPIAVAVMALLLLLLRLGQWRR